MSSVRLRTWGVVGGLFLLSASAAAYEIAPSSVTPLIRSQMGIGPAAAGWIVSVMYAVAVVASVPVGAGLDRVDVRKAVAAAGIALLIAGVGGWLAGVAGAYWPLIATRVLGGLSYVTIWNAGASLAARAVEEDVRATAVGIFTASAPAGFALGQFGAPLVATALGWAAIFPVFAALAAAGVVVFWPASDDHGALTVDADAPTRSEFRRLAVDGRVWTICGLGLGAFALYLFLNGWLSSYLVDAVGLSLPTAGLLAALFPAVGIVSRTGGGVVSDRLFAGRRRPVAVGGFLVATPAVVAVGFVETVPTLAALIVISGAAVQLVIGLLFSYVREVVDPSVATTAVSMLTAVGLVGAFAAPIGAGALLGATGGYRAPFLAAGAVGTAGLLLALRAPERK